MLLSIVRSLTERQTMALPVIATLLVEEVLYNPLELTAADEDTVNRLITSHMRFDCYCPPCKKERTFATLTASATKPGFGTSQTFITKSDIRPEGQEYDLVRPLVGGSEGWLANRHFSFTAYCTRHDSHVMKVYFAIQNKKLLKVGQYPSLADIATGELRRFQKVLGHERAAELQRAVGLAAHGVGVGSFVYLRRVFESLLLDHKNAAATRGQDISGYDKMHVNERVEALKATLPPFLVGNQVIYKILSLGVHTASEEKCLDAFSVLKNAIILILQQDAERLEHERVEKELSKEVSKIAGKFTS